MTRALPMIMSMLGLLVAACSGGGGSGPSSEPPGAPVDPGPSTPGPTPPAALDRPISPMLLCRNGLAKRFAAQGGDHFVEAANGLGIDHSHRVDTEVWGREPASLESVMRIGAVVAADVNADCWPDLIFTTGAAASGQLVYYENRGGRGFDPTLLDVSPGPNPIAAIGIADLDGDYRLDLAVGNLLAGQTEIYRGGFDGRFDLHQTIPMPRSTFGFAFGDYSGDGWLDAFAAHWDLSPPADAPALFRNAGDDSTRPTGTLIDSDLLTGTTSESVSDFNLAPAFVDLDGDGYSDLLIASDFGTSEVLLNTGLQSYEVVTGSTALTDENAAGHAIRDFDNDGRWDWFVASVHAPEDGRPWPWGTEGNKLYWGDAEFPYLLPAGTSTGAEDAEWPWGVCAEDFNNDGLIDLFVENGFGYAPSEVVASQPSHPFMKHIDDSLFDKKLVRARLFINQGDRTFVDRAADWGITELTNGRGVACFDYDRDGDIDIAVAQSSLPALLYENRHSAAHRSNFVSLRLLSLPPNAYAVGAVVSVEAGGVTQMRRVAADGTFQGQSTRELHFGLGTATRIDRIRVHWPEGGSETYSSLPVNRFVTLLDPRMLDYSDPARLARVDAAIASALSFVAVPEPLSDDLLLALTWSERMHELVLPYSPAAVLDARVDQYEQRGQTAPASQLRAWRRLYDPTHQIDLADYGRLLSFDAITFVGVYCHQRPLDDGYIRDIEDLASQGGYSTTHALLALIWAIDNDCDLPPSYDPALIDEIVRDVYEIADGTGAGGMLTDLRVEAMAMLAAAGRHDLIQVAWVDEVLDAQLENGGWKAGPNDADPSHHTTALALWLMLQLADDNKVLSGFVAQAWDGV